ncbi:LysR family transcriptional regulator [Sphingobacterium suaedae]|uniref:LysR family transcriptional regulator n=1 Tax=Sphingobacterium suaedae TaxID=1686402 RepID=A0ABW5KFX9_9SPHI
MAAKELSFKKASRELFISQPAVSKYIQELEATIGQCRFL